MASTRPRAVLAGTHWHLLPGTHLWGPRAPGRNVARRAESAQAAFTSQRSEFSRRITEEHKRFQGGVQRGQLPILGFQGPLGIDDSVTMKAVVGIPGSNCAGVDT